MCSYRHTITRLLEPKPVLALGGILADVSHLMELWLLKLLAFANVLRIWDLGKL